MVTLRMQADLKLQVGTRLFYDCPMMSGESSSADAFFKKYGGREATVVGLTTKLVPPFNHEGLYPGVYYDGGLSIQFDDDDKVHVGLNLKHFVVIGQAELLQSKSIFNLVAKLPEEPAFYPLDVVAKADDLLVVPRLVTHVDFDKQGRLVCHLADTEDMERHRKEKEATQHAENRSKGLWFPVLMFRSDEQVLSSELRLVERGNGYQMYHYHDALKFTSPEEELAFWALDGLSRTVFEKSGNWMHSLSGARELVHVGKADIIVASHINRRGEADHYEVRRLHDLFKLHRDRVRELAEQIGPVPKGGGDSFKALTDVLTLR